MRSSLTRARRPSPKKRRRAQRKMVRPAKKACSDTIEETISSTDEAVAQRKRARFYKGSSPSPIKHPTIDTSLHITTFHSHNSSSHRTMHYERGTVSWSVLHILQLETDSSHEPGQSSSARALVNNLGRGGYAGTRVGEAENPGPRHARQGLDGNRATQRQSQTDQRCSRLSAKEPGLRDEESSKPAHVGFFCSSGSASPATVINEGIPEDPHDRNSSPESGQEAPEDQHSPTQPVVRRSETGQMAPPSRW